MKNLESKLFLLIAFFIGTWGALFHAMQTGLIALGLIYNIVKYKDDFVRNIKKYKYYVAIPVIYIQLFIPWLLWLPENMPGWNRDSEFLKKNFWYFYWECCMLFRWKVLSVCGYWSNFYFVFVSVSWLSIWSCFFILEGRIGLLLHRLSCKICMPVVLGVPSTF